MLLCYTVNAVSPLLADDKAAPTVEREQFQTKGQLVEATEAAAEVSLLSFAAAYARCTAYLATFMEQQKDRYADLAPATSRKAAKIAGNPYLQRNFDLWLVPWSSQSSVIGYRPGSLRGEINGVAATSRAWVSGWPVLTREVQLPKICGNTARNRSMWDGVYAVKSGIILGIVPDSRYNSYGNFIMVQHDSESNSPVTLYAHLAEIADGLEVGARVGQGQRIARLGSSGRGGGGRTHLHLSYFSSLERILDESGELEMDVGALYRLAQNPVYFITEGAYPTNTYIGNFNSSVYEPSFFNQLYRKFHRFHEGIDFSGGRPQLIDGWEEGLLGSQIVTQYRKRAILEREPWLYELDRR